MDQTTAKLANYATSLSYEDLTPEALRMTGKLLLDTVGCAIGGYHSEPARIARRVASRKSGHPPVRVWGSGEMSSMDAAAFANGVMVRYLDFNDTYMSVEVAHPSDAIPAILAVAEAHHASGKAAITAIVTMYEVFASFADACNLFNKGFDHGFYIAIGATAGIGNLLGLDRERMANAIALTCAPNVPLRQTRSGALTMWKGCAAPAAARASITAIELALEGMTGPSAIFEGRHGVFDQVTRPFELAHLGTHPRGFGVERTGIKFFPTEYHSQIPLGLILDLRRKVAPGDVERVHAETYNLAYSEIGSEPQKWDPHTRETADHSLPYMLAAALQDGSISIATFDEARIRDPGLRPLMNRITVSENDEFTKAFPGAMMNRIEIVSKSGGRHVAEGRYPKGHLENPMTDAEVETKYRALCEGLLPEARAAALLESLWNLEREPELGKVLERTSIEGA